MTNGGKCTGEPCTAIAVTDLDVFQVVAKRELHSFAAQLIGAR
jgi:hypothetical protein